MTTKYPFYFKSTIILFGVVLLVSILSGLRDIMVPLAFAILLSILLNPLCEWFRRKKIPHTIAILLSMLIALIIIACILYFISSHLLVHELQNGRIIIPTKVIPAVPDVLPPELSDNPHGLEVHAAIRQLYENFISANPNRVTLRFVP